KPGNAGGQRQQPEHHAQRHPAAQPARQCPEAVVEIHPSSSPDGRERSSTLAREWETVRPPEHAGGLTLIAQAAISPKRPLWKSFIAWRISSAVFITNGPCMTTGSSIGSPLRISSEASPFASSVISPPVR